MQISLLTDDYKNDELFYQLFLNDEIWNSEYLSSEVLNIPEALPEFPIFLQSEIKMYVRQNTAK